MFKNPKHDQCCSKIPKKLDCEFQLLPENQQNPTKVSRKRSKNITNMFQKMLIIFGGMPKYQMLMFSNLKGLTGYVAGHGGLF